MVLAARGAEARAFVATTVAVVATAVLLFGSLFPDVMPASSGSADGLTVRTASSGHYTLVVMTWWRAC